MEIISEEKCVGCSVCESVCPHNAISMKENVEGFFHPKIDQDKCTNCGICKKSCPVLVSKLQRSINDAYAAYNKDESERLASSSGGIFKLLANDIIDNGGVVVGAGFDKSFNVVHRIIEQKKDLYKIMGSKYSQSNLHNIFSKIKEHLNEKKLVLFSGTPCQVSGLKSYLKKDYINLYTVDIICHGVPSPKIYQKYLKEKFSNIQDINFRDKSNGWKNYNMKIIMKNNTYCLNHSSDSYFKLFLSDTILRKSCYNCSFKGNNRCSDITLGDYWGIDKIHPEINDDKGISAVIINNSKGYELFNKIKEQIIYRKTDFDKVCNHNLMLIYSTPKPCKRDIIMSKIDDITFDQIVSMSKKNLLQKVNMKIKRLLRKAIRK